MFDRVEIWVQAGNGGNGSISFRHEKFVPLGGPDGGDGGDGGNIVIQAETSQSSLRGFRQKRLYRAEDGKSGLGKKKHGKSGEDRILMVPPGTVVIDETPDGGAEIIADLQQPEQQAVIARGGKGGRGNTHYATSTNQAPQIAQGGEPREKNLIRLEMRLIADVGIIGYPNVGKSTLLAAASAAKPKIASYPFTTLEPALGVVSVGRDSFVMADIPGLIEGAHLGRGLGHDFLRHIMRTRVLVHLLEGSSADPTKDMAKVNEELLLFDLGLAGKPQLVAVNKIDMPEVQDRLVSLEGDFADVGVKVLFISAATGQGVSELMAEAAKVLERLKDDKKEDIVPRKVFRPQPKGIGRSIRKVGNTFVVEAPELERLMNRGGSVGAELRLHLKQQLGKLGISKSLERAGIKAGDKIRCGDLEWEW